VSRARSSARQSPSHRFPGVNPLVEAQFAARFDFHPLGRPVRLFNTYRADPYAEPPRLTAPDEVPGPIPDARLTTPPVSTFVRDTTDAANPVLDARQWTGNPGAYVDVDTYIPGVAPALPIGLEVGDDGIQLFLPEATFGTITDWSFRGESLAVENGLRCHLAATKSSSTPIFGRVLFGVDSAGEVEALRDSLRWLHVWRVGEIGAIRSITVSLPRRSARSPTVRCRQRSGW
jgi:hypothetical protein